VRSLFSSRSHSGRCQSPTTHPSCVSELLNFSRGKTYEGFFFLVKKKIQFESRFTGFPHTLSSISGNAAASAESFRFQKGPGYIAPAHHLLRAIDESNVKDPKGCHYPRRSIEVTLHSKSSGDIGVGVKIATLKNGLWLEEVFRF